MSEKQRPETLNEIWTERELCEKFGLRINEVTGISRQVGNWIKDGLPFVGKSGNRYFYEKEVIEFLHGSHVSKVSSQGVVKGR